MHYDPDISEVIPFTKYENINIHENPLQERKKTARVCFNFIIIAYICAISSLIAFIALLAMKLDHMVQLNNMEIILPFIIFLLFCDLLCNKIIAHPSNNFTGLGKFFLYFTHNTCFLFIFLFVLIMGFKLDESISLKFAFIFIPLDLIFAITFLFICFIFPGLLDKNIAMYQEAFLLISYYVFTLLTVVLLTIRLDELVHWNYYIVFIAELSLMFLHFLLILKNVLSDDKGKVGNELLKLLVLALVIIGFVFSLLKSDGILDISWKAVFVPVYILIIILTIQSSRSFLGSYKTDDQE